MRLAIAKEAAIMRCYLMINPRVKSVFGQSFYRVIEKLMAVVVPGKLGDAYF